jgi:predicted DNA-binding transcriptional regulator AlpA
MQSASWQVTKAPRITPMTTPTMARPADSPATRNASPYLDRRGLAARLLVSLSTLDRLLAGDLLPRSMRPSKRRLVWLATDIDAWLLAGSPTGAEWAATRRA